MKRLLILSSLFIAIFAWFSIANANSSYFVASTYCTTSATSSKTQIFPGAATTTCAYDSFNISSSQAGVAQPVEGATLFVQQTASSAASTLIMYFEYSHDGIDWYRDTLDFELSTTTSVVNLQSGRVYQWNATSTAVAKTAVNVRTPTRYVRANFAAVTATTSVWAQFIPKREVRE